MLALTPGLWPSPAEAGRQLLLMKPHWGKSSGTVLVRTEPFLSSWQPTGWSPCLVHEPAAADLIDHTGSQPLPTAIASRSFVGCDKRLKAGKRTVDFTRRNSPYFDKVARRLTNGDDQMLWDLSFVVDDDLIPYFVGGSGCPESCPGRKQPAAKVRGKWAAPDLRGFKVDLIRLRVRDSKWSTTPAADGFYLNHDLAFTWEIYGRKR